MVKEKVSVLAFEKKLVPSDGRMYGTTWEKRNEKSVPLKLIEKSVRGTISNRPNKKDKAAFEKDPAKLDAKVESPNLQTIDVSALGTEQDTLKLYFTLKVLGGVERPSACNNAVFNQSYKAAVRGYIEQEGKGFRELARRYATNIANARFLWRNRVGAENIEVQVNALNKNSAQSWTFDATQFSTKNFDFDDPQINSLAERIASVLSSENDFLMLEITCFAKVGKAQEIYPSEELVLDKGNSKTKKSKILYSVDDIAAMHSQKIGNALRTIDTWYPNFADPETSFGEKRPC